MTPQAAKDLFRAEVQDTAAPYLWSDAEVYQYIDDAQKMFCRLTDGISDATTPAVVEVAVSAGATWLDLHPSILLIRDASRTSDGAPLAVLNYEDLAPRGLRLDGRTGPLRTLIVGMEENKLRLPEAAKAADTIRLLVFRLPIADITGANGESFEIAPQHHLHLLKWAQHLAYLKQDSETLDKTKSEERRAQFTAYCTLAKAEQAKKRHKVRTVAYGGIGMNNEHWNAGAWRGRSW